MIQSKSDLESWYHQDDPWGYKTNPDDLYRRDRILTVIEDFAPFDRALDIGCGEGFITADLPATFIDGIEVSDKAAARLPGNVRRVHVPEGHYDLVLATGILYEQYDWGQFTEWILNAASRIVLTCHIASWEINTLPAENLIYEEQFAYREFTQNLRVFEVH